MKNLLLMKIGAAWCGPCTALAKRGTLEKFVAEHEDVKLEVHDDTETGSKTWENFADKWGIKATPTLIWLYDGEELLRSSNTSMADIKEQYARAKRKAGL